MFLCRCAHVCFRFDGVAGRRAAGSGHGGVTPLIVNMGSWPEIVHGGAIAWLEEWVLKALFRPQEPRETALQAQFHPLLAIAQFARVISSESVRSRPRTVAQNKWATKTTRKSPIQALPTSTIHHRP